AALAQALLDPDIEVRRGAVGSLREIGTRARAAIPALIEALKDPQNDVGSFGVACVDVLAALGEGASAALPTLTDLLLVDYFELADEAAQALPSVDPSGKTVLPILLERMKS